MSRRDGKEEGNAGEVAREETRRWGALREAWRLQGARRFADVDGIVFDFAEGVPPPNCDPISIRYPFVRGALRNRGTGRFNLTFIPRALVSLSTAESLSLADFVLVFP